MSKLAFGVFLFGIVIPFPLWIISVRAAEAGFILSALMMLLALVLGWFSFRETLGKVTVVCSSLTLLVYGVFIASMVRFPGPNQPDGEPVATQNSEPQPMPEYDFSTQKGAAESMIKAAKKGDKEAFKRRISSKFLEKMMAETTDLSEPMRDFSSLVVTDQGSNEGDFATVVTHKEATNHVMTIPLIRENNEWKIHLPGKPQ